MKQISLISVLCTLLSISYSQAQSGIQIRENHCQTRWFLYQDKNPIPFIDFNQERPFLTIAKGTPKVKYKMASFHFKDKVKERCTQQVIDEQIKKPNQVLLKGHFEDCDCTYEMQFTNLENGRVDWKVSLSDTTYNRIFLTWGAKEAEQFFGFGEQYSQVNMKGKQPFIFSEEQGIGRGDKPVTGLVKLVGSSGNEYTSYAPIPFYLSTENKACFVHNTTFMEFDLKRSDKVRLELWDHQAHLSFWQAETPLSLLEKYTTLTGRFPELPDWAYGTWLGLQGGAAKAEKMVQEAQAANNPVSAIWIQDWVGKRKTRFGSQLWWIWQADEKSYPNFKAFCTKMNEEGVKVLGYVNSFLANEGAMCEEAKTKGYLVKDPTGNDYLIKTAGFPAYLVDLSNPAAFEWLKGIIKTNMIEQGLSGWMADYAEWLPWDAQLHSGESAEAYHNKYPVEWARLNREAIAESGKLGEIVFFTRAGYSYSNKYSTLFWMGDQLVSWGKHDGLASTVPAMLSSGMSGLALNHSDIGGYTNVNIPFYKTHRSRELFYRWSELNAFTPIFRTHEGLMPEKNVQPYTDAEATQFFAKIGKLHHHLKDYFKLLMQEHHHKGWPLVRHLYLHYPNDPQTYHLPYQFLLGADLLVLPVLAPQQEEVNGYFPAGIWENIWTGEQINGEQWKTVAAPIGQPAAFIKLGGEQEALLRKAFSNLK